MIRIFFSIWRIASFVFLMIVLFFVYVSLPDSIAYIFGDDGLASKFIDKQSFFYYTLALVGLVNLFFLLAKNRISKINFAALNTESVWAKSSELPSLIKSWIDALLALINSYLVFVILGIYNINSETKPVLDFNYTLVGIIGLFLLMLVLFFLPLKILFY